MLIISTLKLQVPIVSNMSNNDEKSGGCSYAIKAEANFCI